MTDVASIGAARAAATPPVSTAAPSTEQDLSSHFDDVLADLLKIASDAESAIAQVGQKLEAMSRQEDGPPSSSGDATSAAPTGQGVVTTPSAVAGSAGTQDTTSSPEDATQQSIAADPSTSNVADGDKPSDPLAQLLNSVRASRAYDTGRQITAMADSLFAKTA